MNSDISVRKGAHAAVARSRKSHEVSLPKITKPPIAREHHSNTEQRIKKKHPLTKPRCRSATALVQDCNDIHQLVSIPDDIFSIFFKDKKQKYLSFVVFVVPQESLWKGATFGFECTLPLKQPYDYPFRPPLPVVLPGLQYYHPNISLKSGKFSSKALSSDWKPQMRLKGFCTLLYDAIVAPDPEHAINIVAGREMVDDPDKFHKDVQSSLNGSRVMVKINKRDAPKEMRFPSKFGQAKLAAEMKKKWMKIR